MALRIRLHSGWVWTLLAGIVVLAFGLLILFHLSSSAAWTIGLLVGIKLNMMDWTYRLLPVMLRCT